MEVRALGRLGVLVACAAMLGVLSFGAPAQASIAGPSCGQRTVKNRRGIVMQILFARNGTVQAYRPLQGRLNTEAVNDMRIALQREYGPAGVDAPPVRIIAFKSSGSSGMLVPEKAVDSCGRTLTYN